MFKCISGGQYGASIGGLAAAKDLGIQIGGTAPNGWETKYGPNPNLKLLGLVENSTQGFSSTIHTNVKDSDGTIRFAYDFKTSDERVTFRAILKHNKPHYDFNLKDPDFCFDVSDWILKHDIHILNVSGNSGNNRKESNKIFNEVRKYFTPILRAVII